MKVAAQSEASSARSLALGGILAGALVLMVGGGFLVWYRWPQQPAQGPLLAREVQPTEAVARPPHEVPTPALEAPPAPPAPPPAPEPPEKKDEAQPLRQESIPRKAVEAIKAATVFVKVKAGTHEATGSGFVMKVDGATAYLVTNHHVLAGPPPPKGAARKSQDLPPNLSVQIVFSSGAPQERVVPAQVVSSDYHRDLAVLQVTGVRNLPNPLDRSENRDLIELMPVYIFGFPFGELLSLDKGNPAITVGRGAVSSIRRNERGEVAVVQQERPSW